MPRSRSPPRGRDSDRDRDVRDRDRAWERDRERGGDRDRERDRPRFIEREERSAYCFTQIFLDLFLVFRSRDDVRTTRTRSRSRFAPTSHSAHICFDPASLPQEWRATEKASCFTRAHFLVLFTNFCQGTMTTGNARGSGARLSWMTAVQVLAVKS